MSGHFTLQYFNTGLTQVNQYISIGITMHKSRVSLQLGILFYCEHMYFCMYWVLYYDTV